MTAPAPPLVVFDLGGVLVRICRSWEEACGVAGLDVRSRGRPAHEALGSSGLVRRFETGEIDEATFFAAASREMEGAYSPDEVERVHAAWLREEYAGVPALLDALEARGIDSGILSNTNAAHWRRQLLPERGTPSAFPSLSRVRHPHASHLLRAAKPSREAFARFEAATGRGGDDVVFFDDLATNVEAARAHGWRAHVVDPAGDPPAEVLRVLREHGAL